jgi:hypothetical protein
MAPAPAKGGNGGVLKDGPLKAAIDKDFGGLENMKKEFNAATLGIQGSGWGWLVCLASSLSSFLHPSFPFPPLLPSASLHPSSPISNLLVYFTVYDVLMTPCRA